MKHKHAESMMEYAQDVMETAMKEELNVYLEKTLDVINHSDVCHIAKRIQEYEKFHRIMHLRRLLLVYSYFYYVLDDQIVSDDVWQSWADELVSINKDIGFYDEEFKDWDGSTIYHLPFLDKWIVSKALQIRRLTRVADYIDRGDE